MIGLPAKGFKHESDVTDHNTTTLLYVYSIWDSLAVFESVTNQALTMPNLMDRRKISYFQT